MNEPTINSEPENATVPQKAARIARISLWMGILAAFPYVCMMLTYLLNDLSIRGTGLPLPRLILLPALLGLILGAVFGSPFGLAGIITGIIGLIREPKTKQNVVFVLTGILLGMGGILGHIWYFATCQFCQ